MQMVVNRSPSSVPASDFARQWQSIRDDALEAIERVGRSGRLILGEEVRAFEQQFAQWWGVPYAVGVASGLDALEVALRCAGVGPGARVLTTPLSAFATTLAVVRAGAEPVWCDVEESGGLDLDQVDACLRADRSIRAVMPVHLYGHPIDPGALERLATEHGVPIVEDCAQSTGAVRAGRPTATVGLASATSLYPTKNLGAMGDGGVLLTGDAAVAERAKRLRNYGQDRRYEHLELGLNSRLDEIHAAILRSALLPRLDGWLIRRRAIAARYTTALAEIDGPLRPIAPSGGSSCYHLYPVEVTDGDPAAFAERVKLCGVSVDRHYPLVCPDQPAARSLGSSAGGPLPVARRLAACELSLPMNPHLTDDEVERVIEACVEAGA
jgi:dTDP-4-amino-4,6-dideoxygalactose transaminase